MTPDQRKQLEEMAKTHATDDRLVIPYTRLMDTSFMAGAQAGMDMATKAEREKYEKVYVAMRAQIRLRPEWFQASWEKQMEAILNPGPMIDCTEERES